MARTTPPGPRSLAEARPFFRALRRSPLEGFPALRHRYGDIAAIEVPRRGRMVLASHPDQVQQVLQGDHRHFGKSANMQVLSTLLGNGLLTAEGEVWRTHRRLAQPAFHHQRIVGWADMMAHHTATHVAGLQDGQATDLPSELRDLTLRIVGDALFSVDLTDRGADISDALDDTIERSRERFRSRLGPLVDLPTPIRHRARKAGERLDEVVHRIIDARDSDDPGEDLLGLLMAARDVDTGQRLGREELRDEVMTFLLAGHETTAHALTWTLWLLATSGDTLRHVLAEVDDVLDGRRATFDDLEDLVWTRAAIEEGMRLYPPAWITSRTPTEPRDLGGFEVDQHDVVFVSPWVTHRHPDLWDRPLAFDPRRFVEGTPSHRYAHFPFGAGPRMCIGAEFARVEAAMILATWLQAVDVHPIPGAPVRPEPGVTLRPAHGIPVTVRRR